MHAPLVRARTANMATHIALHVVLGRGAAVVTVLVKLVAQAPFPCLIFRAVLNVLEGGMLLQVWGCNLERCERRELLCAHVFAGIYNSFREDFVMSNKIPSFLLPILCCRRPGLLAVPRRNMELCSIGRMYQL